jgi:hypothetical protein
MATGARCWTARKSPRRPHRSGHRRHAQRHAFRDHQGRSRSGLHVLCEKPMTMTVEEGEDIVRTAQASGKICAVNYCYSAYPMVRHMRRWCAPGDLGKVRLVKSRISAMATMATRRMRTIRACAGAMTRPGGRVRAVCRLRHSRAAHGKLSSRARRWKNFPPISPPPSKAGCWKTTPWSISACRAAPWGGFGPHRWPSAASTGSTFRSLGKPAACAGRRSSPTR